MTILTFGILDFLLKFMPVFADKVNVPLHTTKARGGAEVHLHPFLTLELDWGEWPTACACRFTPLQTPVVKA